MSWVKLIAVESCRVGTGTFVEVQGRELAVFQVADSNRVVVIDNACPHSSGNLAAGQVRDGIVTCPLHQWQFDLSTGRCTHSDLARVARYPSVVRDGFVWADLDSTGAACVRPDRA
jgi:nitrite reductase (NADH) small subunit